VSEERTSKRTANIAGVGHGFRNVTTVEDRAAPVRITVESSEPGHVNERAARAALDDWRSSADMRANIRRAKEMLDQLDAKERT
jgi:hypothetical protein